MVKCILFITLFYISSFAELPFGSGFSPFDMESGIAGYSSNLSTVFADDSITYFDLGAITYYDFGLTNRDTRLYSSSFGVSLPFNRFRGSLSLAILEAYGLYQEINSTLSIGYNFSKNFKISIDEMTQFSSIATESDFLFSGGVTSLYSFQYLETILKYRVDSRTDSTIYHNFTLLLRTQKHTFGREAIGITWNQFYKTYSLNISSLFSINEYINLTISAKSEPLFISLGVIFNLPKNVKTGGAFVHNSNLGWSEAVVGGWKFK